MAQAFSRLPWRFALLALLISSAVATGRTAESASPPAPAPPQAGATFAAKTKSLARRPGLLTTYLDPRAGKLLLELPRPAGPRNLCGRFLYVEGIETGLGSNPVGLDRGQLGETRVVEFRRVGGRVLLEQPNLRYRALSPDSNEVRTVRESFASSVLWAGEIAAEAADGRLLVVDPGAFGGSGGLVAVDQVTGTQTVVSSGGLFRGPWDVAVGPSGAAFVLDQTLRAVVRVDIITGVQTLVSSGGLISSRAYGLGFDSSGDLLIADPGAGSFLVAPSRRRGSHHGCGRGKRRRSGT